MSDLYSREKLSWSTGAGGRRRKGKLPEQSWGTRKHGDGEKWLLLQQEEG